MKLSDLGFKYGHCTIPTSDVLVQIFKKGEDRYDVMVYRKDTFELVAEWKKLDHAGTQGLLNELVGKCQV